MKNIFDSEICTEITRRINQLNPDTQKLWGNMTTAQMLAHCNVSYEMAYEDNHKRPNSLVRFMLKSFVKNTVVNDKPYKKNSRTAPQFIVKEDKDFEQEKTRLVNYIKKTQELGSAYFDNRESHSFGRMTSQEWNNSFYKHLDHHLKQFGV